MSFPSLATHLPRRRLPALAVLLLALAALLLLPGAENAEAQTRSLRVACNDGSGNWYVRGYWRVPDLYAFGFGDRYIPCDMAKPATAFDERPGRHGYNRWIYDGTPGYWAQNNPPPPVNQPVGSVTYAVPDYADHRAVRGTDGQCYREERHRTDSSRGGWTASGWYRSISYGSGDAACRNAGWNAYYRSQFPTSRGFEMVNPDGGTFPADEPPARPAVESANADGASLTLTFDQDLIAGSAPAPSAFRVTVNNARRNVASGGVAVSGKTVTLTLASAVSEGDTVKVRYTKPSRNPLRAAHGLPVATFADQDVSNLLDGFWSATLTAGPTVTGGYGCWNGSPTACSDALSEDSFAFGGISYQILRLMRAAGVSGVNIQMELDKAIPRDWILHADGSQLAIAEATLSNSNKTAIWRNPGLQSFRDRTISLRLTEGGSSGPSGASGDAGGGSASVTGVSVVSDAGADRTYGDGDTIEVRVTFGGPVDVDTTGGTPRIKIDMDPADWGEKWAEYDEGSGTNSLTFVHTVAEPNLSTQGIAVLENTLELNGGTITANGADADLAHDGLDHDANHKVDWQAESDTESGPIGLSTAHAPTVTAVAITSDPGDDDTYGKDDVIRVSLTFDEPVEATGSPRLTIDMDPAEWGEKHASYASGSGSTTLTFTHTVVEPNLSTQGIAVLANTLELNGGVIRSAASHAEAELAHTGLAHDAEHKVNWEQAAPEPTPTPTPEPAPTVSGVAITSDPGGDDTYALGDVIEITLTFDRAVTVTGAPQLSIDMDPADWGTKQAAYHSGSGSTTLTFTHTVVEPNISTQGIAVLANTLELNGGTIISTSGSTAADLSHTGLAHDAGHKVDWQLSDDDGPGS